MMTELDNYDAKCYDHPLLEELSGKEREQFEEALQGFEEIMHLFAQLREAQGGDPETSTFAPPSRIHLKIIAHLSPALEEYAGTLLEMETK